MPNYSHLTLAPTVEPQVQPLQRIHKPSVIKIFNHYVHWRTLLRLAFDFSFVFGVVLFAVIWLGSGLPVDLKTVAAYGAILAICMVLVNNWLGFYHRAHLQSNARKRGLAVLALYLAVPIAYGVFALLPLAEVSRDFLELSAMVGVFGVLTYHVTTGNVASTLARHRILIFGGGDMALAVERSIALSDPAVEVVGFYPSANETRLAVPSDRLLSRTKSLTDTALALNVDEIVVALSERRGGSMPLRELLDCKLYGVRVLDLASYFEQTLGQIRLDALYAGWLIFGEGFDQGWLRRLGKRIVDIVGSLILLLLAVPVMLVTAIAIVVESGFPIFYRQERVGLNGRTFNVIKFRSMGTDAEKDGRPRWATAGDNRVTRVGRVIRKLRIDELPQLFCVLDGSMSLVGPRPERPFFVDKLIKEIPFYAVRHSVKPGVTGWAQVRYHYGASIEDTAEKLQYDLYYVKNHTFFLDLVVLFDTVGVVLTGKGAQ